MWFLKYSQNCLYNIIWIVSDPLYPQSYIPGVSLQVLILVFINPPPAIQCFLLKYLLILSGLLMSSSVLLPCSGFPLQSS